MHVADLELNILGANGIVGAAMPLSVGAALAITLQGRRPGGRGVLRRRRHQPGHLPRVPESRRRCGSCRSCSCARTTSTRSAPRTGTPPRSSRWRSARPRYGIPGSRDRRQRRARGARGGRRGGGAGARRRGPEPDRGDDLALGPAQHARQPARPAHGRGDERLEGARSDRPAARACWSEREIVAPGELDAHRCRGSAASWTTPWRSPQAARSPRRSCWRTAVYAPHVRSRGAGGARRARADLRRGAERGDGAGDGSATRACS